jgi:hypothetical protein
MRPPPDVVDAFVWQPIAELPSREVFAFGRPWDHLVSGLGPPRTQALGASGRDYGSTVHSRAIRVYALPSGQRLIVEWHEGSAGPPSRTEIASLKAALACPRYHGTALKEVVQLGEGVPADLLLAVRRAASSR